MCLASLFQNCRIHCVISSRWFILHVLWFSIILICYSIFIQSASAGCLGCVHCRPVNSSVAINICVWVLMRSVWVELLSHRIYMSSALLFSTVVFPKCLPASIRWVFYVTCILSNTPCPSFSFRPP